MVTPVGEGSWWKHAYEANEDIDVQYELEFKGDIIKPGTRVKVKNNSSVFLFRCLAHNVRLDTTWIDVMEEANGRFRSFRVHDLKCVVKAKRSRKKKPNV